METTKTDDGTRLKVLSELVDEARLAGRYAEVVDLQRVADRIEAGEQQ